MLAKRPKNLPIVLTKAEVQSVLKHMKGVPWLVAVLLYGAGLRLLECLTLRVKDVDFERMEIRVRRGKGQKDRVTMLPASAKQDLIEHLKKHQAHSRKGFARRRGANETARCDCSQVSQRGFPVGMAIRVSSQ